MSSTVRRGEGGGQICPLSLAAVAGDRARRDDREHPRRTRKARADAATSDGRPGGCRSLRRFDQRRGDRIGLGPLPAGPRPAGRLSISRRDGGQRDPGAANGFARALLVADGPSILTLEGGTHKPVGALRSTFSKRPSSPSSIAWVRRSRCDSNAHGFFPAGGGRITVRIEPSRSLAGFDLLDRGEIESRRARVLLANLPAHIGNRELDTLRRKLNWKVPTDALEKVDASGPGNVVIAELVCQHVTEVFTGFGRQAVKAERVADEVVSQVRDYLVANVPVGPYLADQLLLPARPERLASRHGNHQRGGSFRTIAPHPPLDHAYRPAPQTCSASRSASNRRTTAQRASSMSARERR